MKQWFKLFHQLSVLLGGSIVIYGAYSAILVPKWESQDYMIMGLAMLIVAGIFKGLSEPVFIGEKLGTNSTEKPAVSVT